MSKRLVSVSLCVAAIIISSQACNIGPDEKVDSLTSGSFGSEQLSLNSRTPDPVDFYGTEAEAYDSISEMKRILETLENDLNSSGSCQDIGRIMATYKYVSDIDLARRSRSVVSYMDLQSELGNESAERIRKRLDSDFTPAYNRVAGLVRNTINGPCKEEVEASILARSGTTRNPYCVADPNYDYWNKRKNRTYKINIDSITDLPNCAYSSNEVLSLVPKSDYEVYGTLPTLPLTLTP